LNRLNLDTNRSVDGLALLCCRLVAGASLADLGTHVTEQSEIENVVAEYVALRAAIDAGEAWHTDLARFFTDDMVYIDPAWGRVEGIDAVRHFIAESMHGLEDWKFPIDFTAISGDRVVVKWTQITPGGGRQSGYSTLIYAGNGKFRYEEDLLNMAHVNEDLRASGWRPDPSFVFPPKHPNRDASIP
jgi:limonene-1,2-epoxide hydrolase